MAVGKRRPWDQPESNNALHSPGGGSGIGEHSTAVVQTESGPTLPATPPLRSAIQAGSPGSEVV